MALDFVPRPGKSPSGYTVAVNFPVSAPATGRYADNTPTVAGSLKTYPKSRPAAEKSKPDPYRPTSKQPTALDKADVPRKVG